MTQVRSQKSIEKNFLTDLSHRLVSLIESHILESKALPGTGRSTTTHQLGLPDQLKNTKDLAQLELARERLLWRSIVANRKMPPPPRKPIAEPTKARIAIIIMYFNLI